MILLGVYFVNRTADKGAVNALARSLGLADKDKVVEKHRRLKVAKLLVEIRPVKLPEELGGKGRIVGGVATEYADGLDLLFRAVRKDKVFRFRKLPLGKLVPLLEKVEALAVFKIIGIETKRFKGRLVRVVFLFFKDENPGNAFAWRKRVLAAVADGLGLGPYPRNSVIYRIS